MGGGQVLASTQEIRSGEDSQFYPESPVTVNIPKRRPANRVSELCDRNSPRYDAQVCQWMKNLGEALKRSGTGPIQRIE